MKFKQQYFTFLLQLLVVTILISFNLRVVAGPTGASKVGSNTVEAPKDGGDENSTCVSKHSKGMPIYTVDAPLISLRITDTPIGCNAPFGPAVPITFSYTQNNATQPTVQNFGNVGQHWYINWISYIQDNPNAIGAGIVRVPMGGGAIPYTGAYHADTGAIDPDGLTLGSAKEHLYLVSTSPVRYELRKSNGAILVFTNSDGALVAPRKIFLSQIIDPQGNALNLTYDAANRLVQIFDSLGRATVLQYNNAGNSLLITDIYDPFGRHAQIGYDASQRLSSLTDVLGMSSSFLYDGSGNISTMVTPYGTTSFVFGGSAPNNWLNITDPLGNTERVEFNQGVSGIAFNDPNYPNLSVLGIYPQNAWQNYRDVFFWDKTVYSQYPGDYTKARIQHLQHDGSNPSATNIMESTKKALDNRVLYLYPGLIDGGLRSGSTDLPMLISRFLPDGNTAITQLTYNSLGNVIGIVDPVGKQTSYTYASNLIDVLQVSQTGSTGTPVVTASYTYNSQHLPVTYTNAAGLTITYTYNSVGQVTSEADSNGNVTSKAYDNNGFLLSITRPDGVVAVRYTYDLMGRIYTETDAIGYIRTYSYDNLDRITRITHPDGSHEDNAWSKLDLVAHSDRAGNITKYNYDSLRRRTSETNALGQSTQYSYYPGGQLKSKVSANGNAKNWTYDVEGRVTSISDELGRVTNFSYDSADRLAAIANPTGQTISFTYDAADHLVKEIASVSGQPARTTSYSYTPDGQISSVVQPDGYTVKYSYDSALRLIAIADTIGNSINYTLDNLGNRIREDIKDSSGVLQRSITRSFDALNRVQQVSGAPY